MSRPYAEAPPIEAILTTALAGSAPVVSWLVRTSHGVVAREPDRRFPSASMIKPFVAVAALERVEAGAAALDTPVAVEERHRVVGDGALKHQTLGRALPLADLIRLMTSVSDNTATNAVIDFAGLAAVNETLERRGYRATRLLRPIGQGGTGVTSAADHDRLLRELAGGVLLPRAGALLLDALVRQEDRRALARHLREDVPFAHKTGTVDGIRHDGGLLVGAGLELAITCFTDGGSHAEHADHPAVTGMGLAAAWILDAIGRRDLLIDAAPRPYDP